MLDEPSPKNPFRLDEFFPRRCNKDPISHSSTFRPAGAPVARVGRDSIEKHARSRDLQSTCLRDQGCRRFAIRRLPASAFKVFVRLEAAVLSTHCAIIQQALSALLAVENSFFSDSATLTADR